MNRLVLLALALPALSQAQGPVSLPGVTVYSPRVANQSPVGTFAMPVSALRYEPQVDVQARNLGEAQADVTVRGGIFENTGFSVGAVTLIDPQTGHYFAEIPIAPAMLGAPEIQTGADLALGPTNATTGAVAYQWRPIRTAGAASVAFGQHQFDQQEVYAGAETGTRVAGQKIGADFAWARSESDGPIAFGEYHFDRVNGRVQLSGPSSQTDLFAGYQAKRFGWPNLYTPFNSDETENLETLLFSANHRIDLGGGDFLAGGVYHRRNKDDYAFNRFAPLGRVHPFQHTTRVEGAAVEGRRDLGVFTLNGRGEILADQLRSTSLIFGRYYSRTLAKLSLIPEKSWRQAGGGTLTVKAGATYDDGNRDSGAVSPVVEIARDFSSSALRRVYASYTTTTQAPTYTALNSSPSGGLFRGNPNLGREKSHNAEVGVTGAFGGWTGQAAVFYRRDASLVDWTFRRNVIARTANPVDLDVAGAEMFVRRSWQPIDVVFGYTLLTKSADYRGAIVDASFYALNYARHRATAAITWRIVHGLELRMDNVARHQADNVLRTTGGRDAVTSSLSLTWRSDAWRGAAVTLHADNLWNSAFQEIPAVPAAGREYAVELSYAW